MIRVPSSPESSTVAPPAAVRAASEAAAPTLAEQLRMNRATGAHVYGFEFFPPKDEEGEALLSRSVASLGPLHPDFVSVTHGASGSNRDHAVAMAHFLAGIPFRAVGHLTCAAQSRDQVLQTIDHYAEAGITHILAIRGDMPGGPTIPWEKHPQGLANATELVELVKSRGDFCVGVAAFPDPHQSRHDPELDARLLADKVHAGAEFAVTQLFFDAASYGRLVERMRARGVEVPILAGIMPITNVRQVSRFADLSGAPMPEPIVSRLREVADDPDAVRRVGADIAADLARDVLDAGAPGLQFFTQNRSVATREILARLRGLRPA